MRGLKEDGLISNYGDYMLLDERVMDDWRMWQEARARAASDAARQAERKARR